jgi:hypothetical protein
LGSSLIGERRISNSPDGRENQFSLPIVRRTIRLILLRSQNFMDSEFGLCGHTKYRDRAAGMTSKTDFSQSFTQLIADMKMDGRYRTFIQLERVAASFRQPSGTVQTDRAAS